MKIVIATTNQGKFLELKSLLNSYCDIVPINEDEIPPIKEGEKTFIENAILKARGFAKHYNLPIIAEDSGICVDFLGGKPGVRSARFAGDKASTKENIVKLLKKLKNVTWENRKAYFYSVLVFMLKAEDSTPLIGQGEWHGKIAIEPRGMNGFGYDPIFYIPDLKKTAAEIKLREKEKMSHRFKASVELLKKIKERGKLLFDPQK